MRVSFDILLFIVSDVFMFLIQKDLHTVVVDFDFLKWMHHSCHGYGKKIVTSLKYFFNVL